MRPVVIPPNDAHRVTSTWPTSNGYDRLVGRVGTKATSETPYRATALARLPLPPLAPMPAEQSGGYAHLGRLAAALGAPHHGSPELHLDRDRVRVVVSLSVDSGKVRALEVEVLAGPYPPVILRTETEADRKAKRRGVSRELQLDDAAFDARVYVDSDASDAVLRAMLESREVRAATVALLDAGCREILFSAQGITLELAADRDPGAPAYEPVRLRGIVDAARALAEAPRIANPEVAPTRRRTIGITVFAGAVLVAGIATIALAATRWDPCAGWWVPAAGGAGVALWLVVRRVVRRVLRGRSSSHTAYLEARMFIFLGCLELGAGGLTVINGALGHGVHDLHGRVESIESRDGDGDDAEVEAKIAWGDGTNSTESIRVKDGPVGVGSVVMMRVGEGALGLRWRASRARAAGPE